MLRYKFRDFSIEETRGIAHSGDAIINIPKNNGNIGNVVKVMVEIKNYTNTVDTDEIEKLRYDMRYNKIKYALFVSIKSGFVGKKHMSIEEFKFNNDVYTILYLPNLFDDLNKMESGVILMDKIIDYHNTLKNDFVNLKWLENSIISHLTKLDTLYTEYNKLKNSYFKMEKNIKQAISDHYSNIVYYEGILKEKINDTWECINKDFGEVEKELILKQKSDILNVLRTKPGTKNVIKIVEIILKHSMYIEETGSKNFWHIMKIKNKVMCGTILKNSKNIHISFENPKIKLDLDAKRKIDNDLLILDKILEGFQ
jgi:hypothetical protein